MSFIIIVYNCAHVLPEDFRENFIGSGRAKTHIYTASEKKKFQWANFEMKWAIAHLPSHINKLKILCIFNMFFYSNT